MKSFSGGSAFPAQHLSGRRPFADRRAILRILFLAALLSVFAFSLITFLGNSQQTDDEYQSDAVILPDEVLSASSNYMHIKSEVGSELKSQSSTLASASPGLSEEDDDEYKTLSDADLDFKTLNLDLGYDPHQRDEELVDDDTKNSSWTAHRRYGIVIDAGSSGSRVHVYSWKDSKYLKSHLDSLTKIKPTDLPVIEKGANHGLEWQLKEKPGISSFANRIDDIPSHIKPLLDFAGSVVPAHMHASTPVYFFATAGLRLVPTEQRSEVLLRVCEFTRENYPFVTAGGCDRHFRVISGELEGIYGWLAVNYLMGGFSNIDPTERQHALLKRENIKSTKIVDNEESKHHTFGFLDMGGASTQIAFEPIAEMAREHADDLTSVRLRNIAGDDLIFKVYVTTFLGFGMNQARKRHVQELFRNHLADLDLDSLSEGGLIRRFDDEPKSTAISSSKFDVSHGEGVTKDAKDKSQRNPESLINNQWTTSTQSYMSKSIKTSEMAEAKTTNIFVESVAAKITRESEIISSSKMELLKSPSPTQTFESDKAVATTTIPSSKPLNKISEKLANSIKLNDPCLPIGLEITDNENAPKDISRPVSLLGTGNLEQCFDLQRRLLNFTTCQSDPCLFNGVHAPISPSKLRFLGVSEYWYTSNEVFNLGGPYTHKKFRDVTAKYCSSNWADILDSLKAGKWNLVNDEERLQLQCFKSAWIMMVLHEGFQIPKEDHITDDSHLIELSPEEEELNDNTFELPLPGTSLEANDKNPSNTHSHFQSVDQIGDFSVSWTLGAILLHAAAEIPQKLHDINPPVIVNPHTNEPAVTQKPKIIIVPSPSLVAAESPLPPKPPAPKSKKVPSDHTSHSLILYVLGFVFFVFIGAIVLGAARTSSAPRVSGTGAYIGGITSIGSSVINYARSVVGQKHYVRVPPSSTGMGSGIVGIGAVKSSAGTIATPVKPARERYQSVEIQSSDLELGEWEKDDDWD